MAPQDINEEILELDTKNASIVHDIPAKVLIGSSDMVSHYLTDIYIYIYI